MAGSKIFELWSFYFVIYMTVFYCIRSHSVTDTFSRRKETTLLQEVLQLVKNQAIRMETLERELTSINEKLLQCLSLPRTFPSGVDDGQSNLSLLSSTTPKTSPSPTTQEPTTIREPKSAIQLTSAFDDPKITMEEQTRTTFTPTVSSQTAKLTDWESNPSLLSSTTPKTSPSPTTQEPTTIREPKSAIQLTASFDDPKITTEEQTGTTYTPTISPQTAKLTGSRGKEFIILFMHNLHYDGSLSIHVTTEREANVNLSTSPYLNAKLKAAIDSRRHFTSHIKIDIPYELTCKYLIVEPKAAILQISQLSTVTIFNRNKKKQSGDGTLIIPTNKLSTKYLISSTEPYRQSNDYYSQFAIGALYERTNINITLKMKDKSPITLFGKTYRDGDIFKLTLNRFETFQVKHTTDLTGTFITSTKAIAVFSGNRCQRFRINYCSQLLTQLPPTVELDNEYIIPTFYNNPETLIQIISENKAYVNTSVGTNTSSWLLNEKESRNIEVASNEATVLVSMDSLSVTAFGMGSRSNDPYMTVIPGVNQYVNYYKFTIPDGYTTNFICVVIQQKARNNLQINGQSVDHYKSVYESLVILRKVYIIRIFDVSNGTFVLSTTDNSNFGMIVYGHYRVDGYAFSGNFVQP